MRRLELQSRALCRSEFLRAWSLTCVWARRRNGQQTGGKAASFMQVQGKQSWFVSEPIGLILAY